MRSGHWLQMLNSKLVTPAMRSRSLLVKKKCRFFRIASAVKDLNLFVGGGLLFALFGSFNAACL